jgi:hypothetical protein
MAPDTTDVAPLNLNLNTEYISRIFIYLTDEAFRIVSYSPFRSATISDFASRQRTETLEQFPRVEIKPSLPSIYKQNDIQGSTSSNHAE